MPTENDARVQEKYSLERLTALVFQRGPSVLFEFTEDVLLVVQSRAGSPRAASSCNPSFFRLNLTGLSAKLELTANASASSVLALADEPAAPYILRAEAGLLRECRPARYII